MFIRRCPRSVRLQWQLARRINRVSFASGTTNTPSKLTPEPRQYASFQSARCFYSSRRLQAVKPVLLADIGEGIVECEIIQWFVEPGARVEEFSKLCEVQSDKASVEITSRFSGIVKKLYYDAGEMARVGKPFVDIDIQGDPSQETLDKLTPPAPDMMGETASSDPAQQTEAATAGPQKPMPPAPDRDGAVETAAPKSKGSHAAFATPAVRHLCKEMKLDILEVEGTGKDGRVLKEDIHKLIEARKNGTPPASSSEAPRGAPAFSEAQTETRKPLTKTQEGMFRTMTRSLNIPHFLYADEIDLTELVALRTRLNKVLSSSSSSWAPILPNADAVSKLSYLPFIVKAVSIALQQYPILNARVDLSADKPALVHRTQHNIGVAMDTPSGLLVPVIKNVGAHSILTIAAELNRLQALAVAGKLGLHDMSGGTISVSNIGSIGGTYCSPVIVEGQVAILGVGRMRDVPDVVEDSAGGWKVNGVRKVCNFSWSADHRVVDGATMARAAGVVRALVEEPDVMVMHLR